jgi:hypothetical protein
MIANAQLLTEVQRLTGALQEAAAQMSTKDELITQLREELQASRAKPTTYTPPPQVPKIKEDPIYRAIWDGTYKPHLQPRTDSKTGERVPANPYKEQKIQQRNQLCTSGAYRGNCVYIIDHPLVEWNPETLVSYEWMHNTDLHLSAEHIYSPHVEPRVVLLLQSIGVERARRAEADLYLMENADDIRSRGGLDIVFADVHGGYHEGAGRIWRVIQSRPWLL